MRYSNKTNPNKTKKISKMNHQMIYKYKCYKDNKI